MKAQRAQINLGDIPLNVYLMPDGSYRLAGRNVTDAIISPANSLLREMGVKSLKQLPGADSSLLQVKSETGETFIPVSVDDAVTYWGIMAKKGNTLALGILIACAAEALERRADAAFGKLRTEDERQRRAALRIKRVDARLGWTDIIKDYQIAGGYYNTPRGRDEFRELTVIVNEALFGQPHFKCDRDTMTVQQQIHIEFFEHALKMQAVTNPTKDPYKLIDDTLKTWAFV